MLTDFLNNLSDKFRKKEIGELYYGYYLFGLYKDKPIWNWTEWKECINLIQPIIDLSPDIPSINSTQAIPVTYGKNNQNISYNKGSLRFGKMAFNEKNNEKWTTKYANEPNWTFFDTEIVYPTFSFCEKHRVHPDIFIKITNENLTVKTQPKINQSIIILFKKKLVDSKRLISLEKNIETLSDKINVVLSGKIIRPAVYPSGFGLATDYIRDGSLGVVNHDTLEFSKTFADYGMQTIMKGCW